MESFIVVLVIVVIAVLILRGIRSRISGDAEAEKTALEIMYKIEREEKEKRRQADEEREKQKSHQNKQQTIGKASNCAESNEKKELFVSTRYNGIPLAYHYENVKLYIVPGQEPDFPSLNPGMLVELVQEPENTYDANAVYAKAGGNKIGYLYRGKIQDMANDFIRRKDPIVSHIELIGDDEGRIEIFLGFYRKRLPKGNNAKTFRLTGNTNADMQESISLCVAGNEVDVDYDYEKNKYLVSDGFPLGYLPKSAEDFVGNDFEAYIESTELTNDLKWVIRVTICNLD